jgi:FkbM family methyltransferase
LIKNIIINCISILPNHIIAVSKIKSFIISFLDIDIYKFCSVSTNFKIEINLKDKSENYLWYGNIPEEITKFLYSNLNSNSVFIDCGANIGIWSTIALEIIKSEGCVHSFEPNPNLFLRLTRNLKFNNISSRCNCYKLALSSESRSSFLYLDDHHHQMGSLYYREKNKKLKVNLITLDSLKLCQIDGMKIDVEGHELQVIKGAMKTLAPHKPWLVVELNNSFYDVQYITEWEVYHLLTGIGYSTNFDMGQSLNLSFCRDIIFYDATKSVKEKFPPFL